LFEDFDQRLEDLCRHVKAVVDKGVSPRPSNAPQASQTRSPVQRKAGKSPWVFAVPAILVIGFAGFFAWRMTQQKSPEAALSTVVTAPALASRAAPDPVQPTATTAHADSPVVTAPPVSAPPSAAAPLASALAPAAPEDRTAISGAAKSFVSMLDGTMGFQRYTAINNLRARMPATLNVNEAALILDGTNSSRTRAIATIAPALLPELDGKEVDTVLGSLNGFERYTALGSLVKASKLGHALTSGDAVTILDKTESSRTRSIALLAPLLVPDLDGQSSAAVLGPLNGFERYTALKSVVDAGKLKRGLSPEDANLITDQMASSKTRALQLLSGFIR
jgi:hypothetical protein